MKSRALWYAISGLLWALVPLVASAAGLVPCVGAADCNLCTFGQLLQNVINFAIGLSIPVSAVLFSYAGWLYFSNRENMANIEKAHKIFTSVLIGFVIAIAGWLIVQTILKTLAPGYQSWTTFTCNNAARPMSGNIGQLLQQSGVGQLNTAPPVAVTTQNYNGSAGGAVVCAAGSTYSQGSQNCQSCYSNGDGTQTCETTAPVATAPPINAGCPAGATLDSSGYNCQVCYTNDGYNDDGSLINPQCDTVAPLPPGNNTDCSAENIQASAAAGGYNLTSSQAATLSCIAVPESSCGSNTSVATTPGGQVTSAAGMFQIVFGSGNDQCHNLNIDVCTQAAQMAGYTVNGSLNCYSTVIKQGQKLGSDACRAAAANIACNASAAACLVQARNGQFTDWTSDSRSSVQAQCIQRYAN